MSYADRLWVVTGAAGFLGNTLVRELLGRGQKVRALVQDAQPHPSLTHLDCEIIPIDVTDPATLTDAFRAADNLPVIVIHCAGVVSIAGRVSQSVRAVNVGGTRNVIEACGQARVSRLVYISSVHAIPEPDPPRTIKECDDPAGYDPATVTGEYAKTKAEATALVLAADHLDRVVVHPSGLIGPYDFGDSHLTRLIRDAAGGQLTAVVAGGYDFVDVRDVARGVIAASLHAPAGRTYLLTGHYSTVAKVAQDVADLSGRKRRFHVLPAWFARASAPFAELYYRLRRTSPLYTAYSLHTLHAPSEFSHARATTELGYTPRPLSETLADTVAWFGL